MHFYELFLARYDPEKRLKRGVFYTPRPIVAMMVRNVHTTLCEERGIEDGLADPSISILDPAVGTGTFLVESIWRDPRRRSGRIESLTAHTWARRTIGAMGHARRRHTPGQIIRKLREADRLLGEGQEVAVVAKQLEVSEQTLHRWRAQYGGLKADDAKRLRSWSARTLG